MNLQQSLMWGVVLLVWGCVVASQAATKDSNPYQAIVERNVFGLVPIPSGPPPKTSPDAPLPKITPNGIMTIFGKLQVLFKVSQPGKPATDDDSYVMSEGDRQDDIAVQKIDEASATITFDNHGTIQELPLIAGKASSGASSPQHGSSGQIPLPRPGIPAPQNGNASIPTAGGKQIGNNANPPNSAPSMGSGGIGANAQSQQKITPEEQVIMIEANRLKAIEDGDPTAKILPITPMTSQTLGDDGDSSAQHGN